MELLINGDIYIKIEPDIIKPNEEKLEELKRKIYELDFLDAHNGITSKTEKEREYLEKNLEDLQEEKLDYNYTDNFHILKITEQGIKLYCYDRFGKRIINKCDNRELKEKYIRLVDFLRNAKYIGKTFIRTEPTIIDECIDKSYMNQDSYETIKTLYQTDYAMLVNYKTQHGNYFQMINPQYLIDKKYTFIGNKDSIYEDKKSIYKQIIDEIEDRYQYYKKYYKK